MQALIFGLAGVLLGIVTARLGWPPILRWLALAVISLAGLTAIFLFNGLVGGDQGPVIPSNRMFGGGVFLLGLWYFHYTGMRRRA